MPEPDAGTQAANTTGSDQSQQPVQQTDANQVQIDKAEFEKLQSGQKRLDEIDAIAKEAGRETALEYIEEIEGRLYEKEVEPTPATPSPEPAKTQNGTNAPAPQVGGMSKEDSAKVDAANRAAIQATLDAKYTDYRVRQNSIPEDKRTAFQKADLDKVLGSMGQFCMKLANDKFDGNFYDAALHILTIEQGADALKKVEATATAVDQAKEAGAASANLQTGGQIAQPAPETPEEKAVALNKELADKIAPDNEPYVYEPAGQ